MNNLQEIILHKIKAGELKMQPRWYFVLQAVLYSFGVVIVTLVAIYLLSFVFFILHRNGLFFAPAFGMRGILFFVIASPWLLISFVALFLVTLLILVRHFAFSYRRPLLYSLLGAVAFVLVVSIAIHLTMMHEAVRSLVEGRNIPGMTALYKDRRPEGVVFGLIGKITDTGFMLLRDDTGEVLLVATSTKTHLPLVPLKINDRVMVFGPQKGDTVIAFGVHPISAADDLPPLRSMPSTFHHE